VVRGFSLYSVLAVLLIAVLVILLVTAVLLIAVLLVTAVLLIAVLLVTAVLLVAVLVVLVFGIVVLHDSHLTVHSIPCGQRALFIGKKFFKRHTQM